MLTTYALRRLGAAAAVAATLGLGRGLVVSTAPASNNDAPWTSEERKVLQSMALSSLGPLPADPSNRYADLPAAARLGEKLFFDTRMSGNGQVSCASCHQAAKGFQDGLALGHGVGTAGRRTMPIAGTAYNAWQFWDGRADSQWAQALGPLESPQEHGGNRAQYARVIHDHYNQEYAAVFGAVANGPTDVSRVYANIGKAIAAYERTITFTAARFDRYVAVELAGRPHTAEDELSPDERAGLRLFIGKANCSTCHNGPMLSDGHFHNTGVPQSANGTANDSGRTTGVRTVLASEFNCMGKYSDAKPEQCSELRFAVTEGSELVRAFKTPSLRNVVDRSPFMHAGQFASLPEVLDHYNRAPKAPAGTSELKKLRLSKEELRQLQAFLGTLVSPLQFPGAHDRAAQAPDAGTQTTR
ncbi:MAG: cytochrome c peroxidase [Gemmatimonadaceae bacterium]